MRLKQSSSQHQYSILHSFQASQRGFFLVKTGKVEQSTPNKALLQNPARHTRYHRVEHRPGTALLPSSEHSKIQNNALTKSLTQSP